MCIRDRCRIERLVPERGEHEGVEAEAGIERLELLGEQADHMPGIAHRLASARFEHLHIAIDAECLETEMPRPGVTLGKLARQRLRHLDDQRFEDRNVQDRFDDAADHTRYGRCLLYTSRCV